MILSMSDVIAMVSLLIAIIAVITSFISERTARKLSTSDYESSENVKIDTARLLATLRSIMLKASIYSQKNKDMRDDSSYADYVDLSYEKDVIQEFLTSSTALAYQYFVSKKSKEAGDNPEIWRTFSLQLASIIHTSNPYVAGNIAGKVELMLSTISEREMEEMTKVIGDLIGAVKFMTEDREGNLIPRVFVESQKETEPTQFPRFLDYLIDNGIDDPDVRLFWGVTSDNIEVVENAIDSSAKLDITAGEIINRYKTQWDEFNKQ